MRTLYVRKYRKKVGMYIVSANYRDRKSRARWLVRKETEKPEEAQEFRTVYATGVTFRPNEEEARFGCALVAVCETVGNWDRIPEEAQCLFFNMSGYFVNFFGQRVDQCAQLFLENGGYCRVVL